MPRGKYKHSKKQIKALVSSQHLNIKHQAYVKGFRRCGLEWDCIHSDDCLLEKESQKKGYCLSEENQYFSDVTALSKGRKDLTKVEMDLISSYALERIIQRRVIEFMGMSGMILGKGLGKPQPCLGVFYQSRRSLHKILEDLGKLGVADKKDVSHAQTIIDLEREAKGHGK